jgi:hypothetical protein
MKSLPKTIILLLFVAVISLGCLSGCRSIQSPQAKKEALPTGPDCDLEPLGVDECDILERERIMQNRGIELNHEQTKNTLDAEIMARELAIKQVKDRNLFPHNFEVEEIPYNTPLFIYQARELKYKQPHESGEYFVNKKCDVHFKVGFLNQEIMGAGTIVPDADGQQVLLIDSGKLGHNAVAIDCILKLSCCKFADNWKKLMQPVEDEVKDGGKYMRHKLIRFIDPSEADEDFANRNAYMGTQLYRVRTWIADKGKRGSGSSASISNGKIVCYAADVDFIDEVDWFALPLRTIEKK